MPGNVRLPIRIHITQSFYTSSIIGLAEFDVCRFSRGTFITTAILKGYYLPFLLLQLNLIGNQILSVHDSLIQFITCLWLLFLYFEVKRVCIPRTEVESTSFSLNIVTLYLLRNSNSVLFSVLLYCYGTGYWTFFRHAVII